MRARLGRLRLLQGGGSSDAARAAVARAMSAGGESESGGESEARAAYMLELQH